MKTKPCTLSSDSLNTGTREYCCSRYKVVSCSMVASLSMAMMSGRGVITSRTMVSRKSARLRSSSRACPSCTASSAASVAAAAGAAGTSSIGVGGCSPLPLAAWRTPDWFFGCRLVPMRSMPMVIGLSRRAMTSNDGSRTSRTRPGSRRTMSSGIRCSQVTTIATMARTSTGKPARSRPVTRASSAAAIIVSALINTRAGMKNRRGSSRYHPS